MCARTHGRANATVQEGKAAVHQASDVVGRPTPLPSSRRIQSASSARTNPVPARHVRPAKPQPPVGGSLLFPR